MAPGSVSMQTEPHADDHYGMTIAIMVAVIDSSDIEFLMDRVDAREGSVAAMKPDGGAGQTANPSIQTRDGGCRRLLLCGDGCPPPRQPTPPDRSPTLLPRAACARSV